MCYTGNEVKLNLHTINEDLRRFGLILAATGLAGGLFQGSEPVLATGSILAGVLLVLLGNIEKST